jgi:cyclopropane fatty-acyl-phospholipid synthase-like methyltransferase
MSFEFDGEKYKKASTHQKEWANNILEELHFVGNESILDLGCGDGTITQQAAQADRVNGCRFPRRLIGVAA